MRPDDHGRARLTAERIEVPARLGEALGAPEHHDACALVAHHSPLVRYLTRCQTAAVALLPLGALGLVIGAIGLARGDSRAWSMVSMLGGGAALVAMAAAQFRAVQHALHIPAGMFTAETPLPPDQ